MGRKEGLPKELPDCELLVDEDGRWWHNGQPVIREDFVALFYESLELLPDGRYILRWQGRTCQLRVKDTAYVVWGLEGPRDGIIRITLSDGSREALDPSSVWVGAGHVPYCRVKSGRFPCRFSRKAYYQLVQCVEERDGEFFLVIGERSFPLTCQE